MALEIIRIINRPIDSNCYIIFDESINNECVIIDPGSEKIDNLINLINELSLNPRFIILTHEHYDHCWGVNDLRAKFPHIKLTQLYTLMYQLHIVKVIKFKSIDSLHDFHYLCCNN